MMVVKITNQQEEVMPTGWLTVVLADLGEVVKPCKRCRV
jgi:hypothetical protein